MGAFTVQLNQTTFRELLSRLGAAPIAQRGEAGEFQQWVCYTVSAAGSRLWLTSSELGGREYIDGFVVQRVAQGLLADAACPEAAGKPDSLVLDHGIRLDSGLPAIRAALGKPNMAAASVRYYAYEGKHGDYDVSSVLVLKLAGDSVTQLSAQRALTR